MANELGICPICGQPVSYYETLRTEKDEFMITNHHFDNRICHVKSGFKISLLSRRGKYEIIETYKKNDYDLPGTETIEFLYLNHNNDPTSAFHVVKYAESGEFKHIDCKTFNNGKLCDNDWKIQSGISIEDYFTLEQKADVPFIESLKIKCLKCNAMFDASNETE
jgi:hypothetical protein